MTDRGLFGGTFGKDNKEVEEIKKYIMELGRRREVEKEIDEQRRQAERETDEQRIQT